MKANVPGRVWLDIVDIVPGRNTPKNIFQKFPPASVLEARRGIEAFDRAPIKPLKTATGPLDAYIGIRVNRVGSMLAQCWRVLSEPQRLRDAVSRRLSPDAFRRSLGLCRDDPHRFFAMVPDRYASNLNKYLQRGGTDCFETRSKFLHGTDRNDGDLSRYYFLKLVCDQLLKEQIVGHAAELGVWKGNTAAILAEFTRRTGSTAYLLDTFDGFRNDDLVGIDGDKAMEFADTSINSVADLVGTDGIKFVKGYFPDTRDLIPMDARFAFVHIDCDLYKPFKAGLEFFYPRLVKGGFLVMHDYGSLWWDGVEKAIDEFFADKPETVIPIPDKAGTAVIRKIGDGARTM